MTKFMTSQQKAGSSRYTSKKLKTLMATTAIAAAGTMLLAAPALAMPTPSPTSKLPTGENVVGGSVTYSRSSDNKTLTATQTTQRAYTLWDSFDTSAGNTVDIQMTLGATSLSVNKVTGDSDGTQFDGILHSNGNVWILDRNGVFFGATAQIDVGGLLASTGDVDKGDVMDGDGNFTFNDFGTGHIVNKGTITVADAGLAAFVSPFASNQGVINAHLGKVAFAAGGEVTLKTTLDLYGDGLFEITVPSAMDAMLENTASGTISAEGGTILMTAEAAKNAIDHVINMDGVATVGSVSVKGGKIILSGGSKGTVNVAGAADARGTEGGDIKVSGENVDVAATAKLRTNAITSGTGTAGDIDIEASNTASFAGRAYALSGENGGNGGKFELSGDHVIFTGVADLRSRATGGVDGTFYLDPAVLTIGQTNALDVIASDTLANQLGLSNVTLAADSLINVGNGADVDLSAYSITRLDWNGNAEVLAGTTANSLSLGAPTVQFNNDFYAGNGAINVDADTLALDARLFNTGGLMGEGDLTSTAGLVKVLSTNALISQAIDFANAGGTVDVAAGTYGPVVLDKDNITLTGANAGKAGDDSARGTETIISATSLGDTGFRITGTNVTVDGFTVTGGLAGFDVSGSTDAGVKNNIIDSAYLAGIYGNGFSGGTIAGNLIDGKGLTTDGITLIGAVDTAVDDNKVQGVRLNGINVTGASDSVSVKDNTLLGDGGLLSSNLLGVNVDGGNDMTVDGNHISNFTAGVSVKNATGTNSVSDNVMHGVDYGVIANNVAGLGVSGNDIHGNSVTGIDVTGSAGAVVSGNTIDEFDTGINVTASANSKVNGNTLTNISGTNINVGNSDGTDIFGNTMTGGTTGVSVKDSAQAKVQGNTINDAGEGVLADNTANIWIYNNDITGSTVNGVHLKNTDGTDYVNDADIWYNRIDSAAGATGILVEDSNFATIGAHKTNQPFADDALDGNTVSGGKDGIVVKNSNKAMVKYNNVHDVTGNGVSVIDSANASALNNHITDAGLAGVYIDPSNYALVDSNTISGGTDGVVIDASDNAVVTHNTISGTSANGVRVSDSGSTTVNDNTINSDGNGVLFENVKNGSTITANKNTIYAANNGIRFNGALDGGTAVTLDTNKIGANGAEAGTGISFGKIADATVGISGDSIDSTNNGIVFRKGLHNGADVTINAANIVSDDKDAIAFNQSLRSGASFTINQGYYEGGQNGLTFRNIAGSANINNSSFFKGVLSRGINMLGALTGSLHIDGAYIRGGDDAIGSNDAQGNTVDGGDLSITRSWLIGDNGDGLELGKVSNGATVSVTSNGGFSVISAGDNGINFTGGIDGSTVTVDGINGIFAENNGILFGAGSPSIAGGSSVTVKNSSVIAANEGILAEGSIVDSNLEISGNSINIRDVATQGNVSPGSASVFSNISPYSGPGGANGVHLAGQIGGTSLVTLSGNTIEAVLDGVLADGGMNGGQLDITNNTKIHGGRDGVAIIGGLAGDAVLNVTGNNDVAGGTGDGINVTDDVAGGVAITIAQNTVTGAGDDGIEVNGTQDALIDTNTVDNTGDNGVAIIGADGTHATGNTISTTGGDGIRADNSDNVVLQGNTVSDTAKNGIAVVNSDNALVNQHNSIDGTGAAGIALNHATNSTVKNNTVSNTGGSGIWANAANGSEILQNIISGTWQNTSRATGAGVFVKDTDDIKIKNNTIDNTANGGDGVEVNDSTKVVVRGNQIGTTGGTDNISGEGIDVNNSAGTKVLGNTVAETVSNGIAVADSDGSRINDNDVSNAGANGILLADSDNVDILRNTVSSTGGNGIYVDPSNHIDVSHNTVDNAGTNGISILGGTDINVNANNIDNAGKDGIRAKGVDGLTLSDGEGDDGFDGEYDGNQISNSHHNGVSIINSSNVLVEESKITNSGWDGIYVDPSQHVTISENDIHGGDYGIHADDVTDLTVTHNTVSDNSNEAIGVYNSHKVKITSNTSNRSGDDGIEVGDSKGVMIAGNVIHGSEDDGIDVYDSKNVTIKKNKVYNAGWNGITADNITAGKGKGGHNLVIAGNLVNGADKDGIHVIDSEGSAITGNTVYNTEGNAIYVDPSPYTLIADNTLGGFGTSGIYLLHSDYTDILRNTLTGTGNGFGIQTNHSNHINIGTGPKNGNTIKNVETGIYVDGGDDVTIDSNKVHHVLDGINAGENNGLDIINNTIWDADGNGIAVYGSNNVWIGGVNNGNEVHNVGNGIWVNGSYGVDIARNNVTNFANDGIHVSGGNDVMINKNHVDDGGNDGIYVEDMYDWNYGEDDHLFPNVVIQNNIVGNHWGLDNNGIEVSNVIKSRITGNTVGNEKAKDYLIGGDGILVANDHGVDPTIIAGNHIFNITGNGIATYGIDHVTIRNNVIKFIGEDGIHGDNNDHLWISGNRIGATGGDGIDEQFFLTANITHNRTRYTGGDGIFTDGYNDEGRGNWANIAHNNVRFAMGDGIVNGYTDRSRVVDNRVTDVAGMGIDIYDGGFVNVRRNIVTRTGYHGINVNDSGYATIKHNQVTDSGFWNFMYESDEECCGDTGNADGIHVENVYGYNNGSGEWVYRDGPYVNIADNTVNTTADDGIEVVDSAETLIDNNNVSNSGAYEFAGDDFIYGNDGISVMNVYSDGEEEPPLYDVTITNNTVDNTGDDGIQVLFSGNTLIGDNVVTNAGGLGRPAIFGADGISVITDLPGLYGDFRDGPFGPEGTNVDIVSNTVDNSDDDGIEIIGSNVNALVDQNTVTNSGDNGIGLVTMEGFFGLRSFKGGPDVHLVGGFNSTISNNVVENSGNNGLSVEGPSHNNVVVSGNVFTDNPVGAYFESGIIDLTGDGNLFNFGDVAMRFAPYELFPFFQFEEEGPVDPVYAPMSLVDDTIGSQFFNGQSTYFVELQNGAFFNPGTPTVLDATHSTYVTPYGTVRPSATGGYIGADVYAFLENRFWHYRDDNTLGLFFFGDILNPEINQEDIFNTFGGYNPFNGNIQFTVNGLPFVDTAFALSLIAPAAGDNDGSGSDANTLANIEPAAGGDENASCWADAVAAAGRGVSVNYNFGTGIDQALKDAAGCSDQSL